MTLGSYLDEADCSSMKVCRMGLPLVDFFDLRRTTDTKKFPRLNEAKITNDNFLFKNDYVLLIYPISKVL